MATYKVNVDGKAPSGLSLGDLVVTGGGTYKIIGFKSDGSYKSSLIDAQTTTYNYTGNYSTPPASGISVVNNSAAYENLSKRAMESVSQGNNQPYQPTVSAKTQVDTLSLADAMKIADQVMTPQFQSSYEKSAANANQRLERAGLYDTVYGQSLAADAERDITRDLNAAIASLALQLSQASEDQALKILELAVKEREFGAEYDANQKNTALKYLLDLLQG
jgi:hypothetical protein